MLDKLSILQFTMKHDEALYLLRRLITHSQDSIYFPALWMFF